MARKFSPEISQLADQYGLGTPVKRHIHLGWIIFWSYLLVMCLLASVVFPLSMFSSSNPSLVSVGCLEPIFLFGVVISVALILMYLPYSAYKCPEGFVELNRRKGKLEPDNARIQAHHSFLDGRSGSFCPSSHPYGNPQSDKELTPYVIIGESKAEHKSQNIIFL